MRRSKKKLLIIVMLVLVFCISIGYAAINMDLDILGVTTIKNQTFDVHFENVQVKTKPNNSEDPLIDSSKTKTTFTVNLEKPGDEYNSHSRYKKLWYNRCP